MAVEIARRERLVIVSPRPEEAIEAIGMVAEKTILDNITTFACPTDDTWTRDHAFISLTDGSRRRLLDSASTAGETSLRPRKTTP